MYRTTHSAQERVSLLVTGCPTRVFMSFYGTKLKVFEQITKRCEKNVVEQTTLNIIAVTSNDISLKTSGKVACTILEVHATNMISHILISAKKTTNQACKSLFLAAFDVAFLSETLA